MIYPYAVNHNGKIYLAGEDVPVETQTKMKLEPEKTEEKKPVVEEKKKSNKKAK